MLEGLVLGAQAATFVVLGALKFADGDWRLGLAQLALAGVTVLVYA